MMLPAAVGQQQEEEEQERKQRPTRKVKVKQVSTPTPVSLHISFPAKSTLNCGLTKKMTTKKSPESETIPQVSV